MAMTTELDAIRTAKAGSANGLLRQNHPPIPRYHTWKNLPDRLLAALLLMPGIPMIAVLVVLVRISSRGPGIYHQVRVGCNGRQFTMYKIRTMRNDAEADTGPKWASVNDPRLTLIGRFIRAVHLDELPQLFNVLAGDMALVGPRPERPEFTTFLGREIDNYLDRLAILPGVTGLAQINLPPDTDLNSVRRKLVLDLDYMRAASLWLDLRILCWTGFRLFGVKRSIAMRILSLYREVQLPVTKPAPETVQVSTIQSRQETVTVERVPNGEETSAKNGHAAHNGAAHKHSARTVKPR